MTSVPADKSPSERLRSSDRVQGLLVVALAFLASLAISLWAKRVSEPEQSTPPLPPTSVGVVGWPNQVDAVATLRTARALTRRISLRGFVAEGVKSDGTIDVGGRKGSIRYSFQSPPGHGPQPPREPGSVPRRNLCGRQSVRVQSSGIYADADQNELPCPSRPLSPLPAPRCTLARIWQHALAREAPSDALARIEYYRAAVGPAWHFELPTANLRFSLYGDCGRELTEEEAIGFSP